jgi:hypothetical protein
MSCNRRPWQNETQFQINNKGAASYDIPPYRIELHMKVGASYAALIAAATVAAAVWGGASIIQSTHLFKEQPEK